MSNNNTTYIPKMSNLSKFIVGDPNENMIEN